MVNGGLHFGNAGGADQMSGVVSMQISKFVAGELSDGRTSRPTNPSEGNSVANTPSWTESGVTS